MQTCLFSMYYRLRNNNELVELLYLDNPPVHITDIRLLAVPMLVSQYDQIDYIQFRDFIVIVHALIYKY